MNKIQLKIKNFGPIRNGFADNDGFMDIPKVTLFCGPQGSGKSTIAKVLSSLIWLEKAASFIGWRGQSVELQNNKILVNLLGWHGMSSYFRDSMEILYRGEYLSFDYSNGETRIALSGDTANQYMKPKIMYVPAERNFLYLLDSNTASKRLPSPLRALLDEFKLAQRSLCHPNAYDIPINGYQYKYDSASKDYYIINQHGDRNEEKTPIIEASSGLQSVLPLLMITDYLAGKLDEVQTLKPGFMPLALSVNPFIRSGGGNSGAKYLGYDMEINPMDIVVGMSRKNSHFINIVEEPEQNLFPPTQRAVLRHLLEVNNKVSDSRLILSTHSPYIVADLVASMKARCIADKIQTVVDEDSTTQLKGLLETCFQLSAAVNADSVRLYETNYDGSISSTPSKESRIPDSNFLNRHLQLGSKLFEQLDVIEEMIDQLASPSSADLPTRA